MVNKIAIFNHSGVDGYWSVHFNGKQKHRGKNNPASLRYRDKCIENLKKFSLKLFPNEEVKIVEFNL